MIFVHLQPRSPSSLGEGRWGGESWALNSRFLTAREPYARSPRNSDSWLTPMDRLGIRICERFALLVGELREILVFGPGASWWLL